MFLYHEDVFILILYVSVQTGHFMGKCRHVDPFLLYCSLL